jgi:glycosyltransferase involved in cell wall biosynthesis
MTRTAEPAVSVITPAYKASQYIAEALDSVFAQTLQDFEIVVTNDASPDTPTLEAVLARYTDPRLRYVKIDINKRVSGARNACIRAARGEFVAFLDADDKWKPQYLERMVATMRSNPGLSVLYSDIISFGPTQFAGRTHMSRRPSTRPVTLEALITEQATPTMSSVMARRQDLLDVGIFDEKLLYAEDFDLWCRLASQGKRFDFIEEPLSMRRAGGAQTGNQVGCLTHIIQVFERNRSLPGINERHLRIIDERIQQFRAELDLYLGKRSLEEKKYDIAKEHLQRANAYFKRPKLQFVLMLLGVAPPLARALNDFRKKAQSPA